MADQYPGGPGLDPADYACGLPRGVVEELPGTDVDVERVAETWGVWLRDLLRVTTGRVRGGQARQAQRRARKSGER